MKKILLNAKNISVGTEHGILLDSINISVGPKERIGLVGPNGSGKSSLMKIMAGIAQPTAGEVVRSASSYYVPQLDLPLFKSEITIVAYLSQVYDEWWNAIDLLERHFGFSELNLERSLASLSGGEIIKLHLSIALSISPEVLFLDEPTNHLDLPSIEMLIEFLNSYNGSIVVVSHDPFFLDQITNTIWEIEDKKVNRFGGNYSDYREQKATILEGVARQHEAARKDLARIKRAQQQEEKRAARSRRVGRDMKHDRSMSTVEKGFFKNKASASSGKNKGKLTSMKDEAVQRAKETQAKRRKRAHVILDSDIESHGRTLLRAHKFNVTLPDGRNLIEDAEIEISYGDRIVITGINGVGKTMFVKTLLGESSVTTTEGESYLAPNSSVVYLSQKYEIVDPDLTLVENILSVNPNLTPEQVRRVLASYLFFTEEDVLKKAIVLSGGEIARLALAMVTSAPIDLLVLDEPTNNLDIETIDGMVTALEDFPGAIIVISHNIDFLARIGVNQAFVINQRRIKRLSALPDNEKVFYEELISELEP